MRKYLLLIFLLLPLLAFADTPKGEKLTIMLWNNIKVGNVERINHFTSQYFQAAGFDETISRGDWLQVFERFKENPIDPTLSDIKATQGENAITVTYRISYTIGGDVQLNIREALIDVWKKFDGKWKLVSEGIFPVSGPRPPPPG